jgi:4-oxalocrotonate tautomerase
MHDVLSYSTSEDSMPGLSVDISGTPNTELSRTVARELTSLTCALLDKKPENTTVAVRYISREDWFINDQSLAALGKNSFRLTVSITEGTNTKFQLASYHQSAFDLLSKLVSDVHPHSNVHTVECSAAGYGYGGVTQEYRHQHPG